LEKHLNPLGGKRLLFVTGKGGVGKTTVTAALALAFERAGLRVLVAVCTEARRMARLLGTDDFGDTLTKLRATLFAVDLVPERAFAEYAGLVLGSRSLTKKAFESPWVTRFLEGVPGLSDWAMLGKAWYHASETLSNGEPRFDVVLIDAPATGHGVEMLRVPRVIQRAAPSGRLRDDALKAWQMLSDPQQGGVVVVTLPEELPTTETLELCGELKNTLGLGVLELVVNAVVEPLFGEEQRRALAELTLSEPESSGEEALALAAYRAVRESVQAECLSRLEAIDAPRVMFPVLADEPNAHAVAERLSHVLDHGPGEGQTGKA
jgi:anion-transporting  ArsA/GET3 family ATPase